MSKELGNGAGAAARREDYIVPVCIENEAGGEAPSSFPSELAGRAQPVETTPDTAHQRRKSRENPKVLDETRVGDP
jgi:hypothetical protein